MQDVIDIEVTPLSPRLRGGDQRCRSHEAALRRNGAGDQGRLGQASRAGVPRPAGVAGRPASVRVLFRRFGRSQESAGAAAQPRRGNRAGSQDNEKVLLVSNIKVDGKPIGAFGEGEFWFHIDGGYTPRPYRYTFLYALELPSTGGNTMFSNMYKAYEAVPAALKDKLKGRKALHIHEYNRARQAGSSGDISGIPHHFHPVFITHPDTGRKTLFVDRLMTTRIEGVDAAESAAILDELYEIGERREFIFEHVWKLGDFVMWDNRCTIHARTDFPKDERRLLRRCTVEGEPLHE